MTGRVPTLLLEQEALISSIEEIRVLRLMTDQAEYAARQSREEAARGGLDVMAKVNEMRKMLSRAREANAMVSYWTCCYFLTRNFGDLPCFLFCVLSCLT